jgi:pSer/pThr/pTyr-binding forkhead associated (FHA) protein
MIKGTDGILTMGWYDSDDPKKNDIGIAEAGTSYISNFHATIEKISNKKKWFIRDGQWRDKGGKLGWYPSTNGVYVNSLQIGTEGYEFKPGDIITLGDTTLKVIVIE